MRIGKKTGFLAVFLLTVGLIGSAAASPAGESAPSDAVPVPGNVSSVVRGVSIAELQAMAQARNPEIAVWDQKIDAARGTMLQASLPYNPTVGYDSEEIGSDGKAGKHGVVVSQELMTGNKRGYAQNAGRLEVEALMRRREVVAQRVANEVRALAWQTQAARSLLAVRTQLKERADATAALAGELRRVGEISEMNLLQLDVQAQEAQLALWASQNALAAVQRELAALVGTEVENLGPISDSLDGLLDSAEIDEETFLSKILAESPQIAEAEAFARQKQAEIALEQSRAKSNVTLGGGVYYDASQERSIAAAGITIPVRLYDQNQGNIHRAQADYLAAVRQVEQVRLEIERQCAQVYRTYLTARQEALIYQKSILPNLKKSYEMNFQAFQQAQIGYLEMANAQVNYFEASAKYIESLQRLADAATLLDGMLLEGNIATDN